MKKFAVVLSGCGFKDGSEITEAVSTLICLSQEGVEYQCFAPNIDHSISAHNSEKSLSGTRNTLEESARITRGNVQSLDQLSESDFDALVFPGGYGAALHLCDWAQKGSQCEILPVAESCITAFHKASKPIGALCIAPALVAKVLGQHSPTVTIGNDADTASEIEKTGAMHEECVVSDYISDRENKILTSPAYMYEAAPHLVFEGIRKMIRELVEMA